MWIFQQYFHFAVDIFKNVHNLEENVCEHCSHCSWVLGIRMVTFWGVRKLMKIDLRDISQTFGF